MSNNDTSAIDKSIKELEEKLLELQAKKYGYSCHGHTYGDYSFGYTHVVVKDIGGDVVAVIVDEDIVRKYLSDKDAVNKENK